MKSRSLLIFLLLVLTACGGTGTPQAPEGRVLSGTATGWNQGSATVAAEVFDMDGNVVYTFAEGEISADGRFTLTLPETVPDAQLTEVTVDSFGCASAGVTASPSSYRGAGFGELSVSGPAGYLGYLSLSSTYGFAAYESNSVGDIFVSHEYADRAVAITGTCTFEDGAQDTFDLSLEPGWNALSYTVTGVTAEGDIASGVFRTGMPGGVQWFFVPAE